MKNPMQPSLPVETVVISNLDAERGTILNGFSYDAQAGGWIEYEVATQYGIERWSRNEFIILSECEVEA